MEKFRFEVTKVAKKDIQKHLKSGIKLSINTISKILVELSQNPFDGIGNSELMKYEYSGFWSRKINKKDRLIYRIEESIVPVYAVSAMGHYLDK